MHVTTSLTSSIPTGIREERAQPRLDFFGERRVFDVGSNDHDLIPARRLNSERSRGPNTIFIVEPSLPSQYVV